MTRYKLRPCDKESRELLFRNYGVKAVAPLDHYLGISKLPFKMTAEVMLECAYWAQDQISFQRAEEKLQRTRGLFVNDDTLRLVSNYVGREVFLADCRKADEAWKHFCSRPFVFGRKRKGVLYLETDGSAVNTRHKDDNGSTWRENKLAIFFSSDNLFTRKQKNGEVYRRILKREYISYIGGVSEFKKHVLAGALRNGYGKYETLVVLSDGAEWISNMSEELFGSDAIHILDYFHLSENVYSYAKAKYDMDEKKYRPWAENICTLLKEGNWRSVLKDLDPGEKYPNTVNLYHYIDTNKNHMNYPEYIKRGLFIGSGAIESSNKVIVQKRLKQAGMRWNAETAQYILTLITKWEGELWETDVKSLIYNLLT